MPGGGPRGGIPGTNPGCIPGGGARIPCICGAMCDCDGPPMPRTGPWRPAGTEEIGAGMPRPKREFNYIQKQGKGFAIITGGSSDAGSGSSWNWNSRQTLLGWWRALDGQRHNVLSSQQHKAQYALLLAIRQLRVLLLDFSELLAIS